MCYPHILLFIAPRHVSLTGLLPTLTTTRGIKIQCLQTIIFINLIPIKFSCGEGFKLRKSIEDYHWSKISPSE